MTLSLVNAGPNNVRAVDGEEIERGLPTNCEQRLSAGSIPISFQKGDPCS